MISVCIATYNGATYIEEQLRSILCQLKQNDEVILVDDCSTDSTLSIIEKVDDNRIHVYSNDFNQGVINTFERAIRKATGDIYYLSDQDDIWHPNKIDMFENVFTQNPHVILVMSDARIINDEGEVITESFFDKRGGFASGVISNIIKNKYLGCTMAFRKSLVDKILPFPVNIPMHDMWIGIISAVYGKNYYIDAPLIDYRRHQNNASPDKRRGLVQMALWRWNLLKSLSSRMIVLLLKINSN